MTPLYIHKTKTSLALCGLSFSLMTALGFYAHHLSGSVESSQRRLASLKKGAAQLQESAAFIQERQKDFSAFETCGFERPITLETLQSGAPYPIELGEPSQLDGLLNHNKLISQAISFSVPCLQDRDIFKFLEQLTSQGPGIFLIHEVRIHRISPLSEEILDKVAAGKPLVLFEGRIMATWIHQ